MHAIISNITSDNLKSKDYSLKEDKILLKILINKRKKKKRASGRFSHFKKKKKKTSLLIIFVKSYIFEFGISCFIHDYRDETSLHLPDQFI